MFRDPEPCTSLCLAKGFSEGNLYVDFKVCPLKYFCDCPCFEVGNSSCETKCNEKGQIVKPTTPTSIGCEICECQCPKSTSTTTAARTACAYVQRLTVICYVTTEQELEFLDLQISWDVLHVVGVGSCLKKVWIPFFKILGGGHLNFKQKLNCAKIFFILFWNFPTFRKYFHHGESSYFWPRNHYRHFNSYGIAFMYHKVSLNWNVVGGHRGNVSSKKIQSQPARNFP